MRFKLIAAILLCVLYCVTPPAPAQSADKVELPVNLRRQNTDVWCWAAAIGMVVEYTKGFAILDCEVLNEYELRHGGRGFCCLVAPECKRTGRLHEMAEIMDGIFKIKGGYKSGPLTFEQIVSHIDQQKPILAALIFGGKSGHVAVIAGYDKTSKSVIIYDPGHGRVVFPYASLINRATSPYLLGSFIIQSPRSIFPKCKRVTVTESEQQGPRSRIECE